MVADAAGSRTGQAAIAWPFFLLPTILCDDVEVSLTAHILRDNGVSCLAKSNAPIGKAESIFSGESYLSCVGVDILLVNDLRVSANGRARCLDRYYVKDAITALIRFPFSGGTMSNRGEVAIIWPNECNETCGEPDVESSSSNVMAKLSALDVVRWRSLFSFHMSSGLKP